MSQEPAQSEISMNELMEQQQYATVQLLTQMKNLTMEQIQTYVEQADIVSEDTKGNNVLHFALSCDNKNEEEIFQIVQWMIERDADVNKVNDNQESPLVWSIYLGQLSVARLLIDSGADKDVKIDGTSLQHFAAASVSPRALEFLKLTVECDFEIRDKKGRTPLMYAAERDLAIHIKWLIAHGVNVMKKDDEGETALFKAVKNESAHAMWALLEVEPYGQLRVRNRHQESVLEIADASKLRNYGALKRLAKRENHFLLQWFDMQTNNIYRFPSKKWTAFLWKIFFILLELLVLIQASCYFFQRDTGLSILFLLLMATGAVLYVRLYYTDPGYIPTSVSSSSDSYYQALLPPQHITEYQRAVTYATKDRVCVTCKIVVPRRSKHCKELNRCVYRYDHYCPFLGNAVGLYNHSFFISFLAWHVGTLSLYFYLAYRSCSLSSDDLTHAKRHVIVYLVISTITGLGCLIMLGFAGSLVVHHLYLVSGNITTNEYMNYAKYDYLKEDGRFKNPYNKGICSNCGEFWLGFRRRKAFVTQETEVNLMGDL